MKKLLLFIYVMFVIVVVQSCKTTSTAITATQHDTITITRDTFAQVVKHDTITITKELNRDVIRVFYDTVGRVTEVEQIKHHSNEKTQQGNTQNVTTRDTLQIKTGKSTTTIKERKPPDKKQKNPFIIFLFGALFGAVVVICKKPIIKLIKSLIYKI